MDTMTTGLLVWTITNWLFAAQFGTGAIKKHKQANEDCSCTSKRT